MNATESARISRENAERIARAKEVDALRNCRARIRWARDNGEQEAICGYKSWNDWAYLSSANRKILESEGYVTRNEYLYDSGHTRVNW